MLRSAPHALPRGRSVVVEGLAMRLMLAIAVGLAIGAGVAVFMASRPSTTTPGMQERLQP